MRKLALLLLLTSAVMAAPNVVVSSVLAEAKGDVRKPVSILVTVENKGDAPSQPGQVVVTLTPKVTPSQKGSGQTMFDPLQLRGEVPALQPNQKVPLVLATPYETRNRMSGQRGSFRVSNIDPTGEVMVNFSAVYQAAPAQR